jgi:hypothetical protein
MSTITCPACSHTFDPSTATVVDATDASVVRWFSTDPGLSTDVSTAEAYANYLRSTDHPPVSRAQFVATLAHLGVEEVLDGDTHVLVGG